MSSVAFSASTFQNSCNNIVYVQSVPGNTPQVSAACLDAKGIRRAAIIGIVNIHNINGHLDDQDPVVSTFHQSCKDVFVQVQDESVYLHAECKNSAGHFVHSEIELDNIENHNGILIQND